MNRALDAKFPKAGRYRPAQRPPYGYRRIGNGEDAIYNIHPAEAAIVHRIFAERAADASVRSIITGLMADGIPTPTGRGPWGTHSGKNALERAVCWSGDHEVCGTKTVCDADRVPLPAFVDSAPAGRAMATAHRDIWRDNLLSRAPVIALTTYLS